MTTAAAQRKRQGDPLAVAAGEAEAERARPAAFNIESRVKPARHAALQYRPVALLILGGALLMWIVCLSVGTYYYNPAARGQPGFSHPLVWFDRYVFRAYGAALPFFVYGLRVVSCGAGLNRNGAKPTLWWQSALLYATVTAARVFLYGIHLTVVQLKSFGYQLVSDHILLAASVLACLTCEAVISYNEWGRPEVFSQNSVLCSLQELGLAGALLSAVNLGLFLCLDMLFTAMYFHGRAETSRAAVAGALLFQAPISWWLLRKHR